MVNEDFFIEKPLVFAYSMIMGNKEEKVTTLKEVWTILKAVGQSQKELSEAQKETDRQLKETDRQIKETSKQIKKVSGHFDTHWGRLMESLVEGDLIKLLQKRGIKVQRIHERSKGSLNGVNYEFDIIAVNGDEVVAVEVKTTLGVQKVNDFLEKLETFKEKFTELKKKTIYGAVAYLRADQSSDIHAEKQGLFVIKAIGNSASITNAKNFKPKVFG